MTPTPTGLLTSPPRRSSRRGSSPGRSCSRSRRRARASVIAAAPRTQMSSLHSRTTMSATSARLGGSSAATVRRSGPSRLSLAAIARPQISTFGGANKRDEIGDGESQRLAGGGHRPDVFRARRPPRACTTCVERAIAGVKPFAFAPGRTSTSASTESSRGEVAEPGAPAAGARTRRSPKSGLRPLAPRNNSPLWRMPRPRLRSTRNDQEIVELAPLSEPMFGERDQIDVAVDRHRHAEPARQQGAERDVPLGKDRALPAYSGGARHHAGQADANARRCPSFRVRRR